MTLVYGDLAMVTCLFKYDQLNTFIMWSVYMLNAVQSIDIPDRTWRWGKVDGSELFKERTCGKINRRSLHRRRVLGEILEGSTAHYVGDRTKGCKAVESRCCIGVMGRTTSSWYPKRFDSSCSRLTSDPPFFVFESKKCGRREQFLTMENSIYRMVAMQMLSRQLYPSVAGAGSSE